VTLVNVTSKKAHLAARTGTATTRSARGNHRPGGRLPARTQVDRVRDLIEGSTALRLELVVHVSAVAEVDDQDEQHVIVHGVYHAEVADPDAQQAGMSG
jgi:hypothetical protein